MKLRNPGFTLAAPLLSIAIALATSNFAAAADNGASTVPAQRDRNTTTVPDNSSTTQRAQTQGQQQSGAPGQTAAQGRSASQQANQGTPSTGSGHECANAPNNVGEGAKENAQGGNANSNANAQGSRAPQNQSAQGAANSNAQVAQNEDNCFDAHEDPRTNELENARGQGTGTTPGNQSGGGQTRSNGPSNQGTTGGTAGPAGGGQRGN